MNGRGIVVAGGGLAAQRCCERLRRSGYDGPIHMICDEPVAPYDRPPLSKDFLSGKMIDPPRLRPDEWYADNDVELLLGRRAALLRAHERAVELAGGDLLPYDALLIATGAAPRALPGAERFANVHVLRTFADAQRLRATIERGEAIAVIGAGFIGQEVAATARSLGAEVTLIEALPTPLAHVVGKETGRWFARLHREEGVDVRLGAGVERLAGNGRCDRIELSDGSTVRCGQVVVGVGIVPATDWLAGTGLPAPHPNGRPRGAIVADHAGRTAVPDVFAAGDCTGSQHWEAAARQGAAAALAMLGHDVPAPPPSSFWSDLYDTRVNWLGDARGADDVTIEGDPGARDFTAVYRRAGRPVAGLLVGRPHTLPELRRLLNDDRQGGN